MVKTKPILNNTYNSKMLKQVLFLKIYFDGFSFILKVEIITIVQGSNACRHNSTKALYNLFNIRTNYRTMTDKIVIENETIAKKQNS